MRGRSYSYSPSPPRGDGRRGRSPSPKDRRGGGHGRDMSTSLLVRNLRRDCRVEDLRKPFGQFGPIKDIYLPRDYYTGEPRGFGFVQYVDPADAADAKYEMDGQLLLGRELTVVFAEENRKRPVDMRARERTRGHSYDNRRSSRYSRSPCHSYSRSRSPRYARSRSNRNHYSPPPRSASPEDGKGYRERSPYSRSPPRHRERSRSPIREHSYSSSQSPIRERSYSPDALRSRSQSQ